MSAEDVQLLREVNRRFNDGSPDDWLGFYDRDCEFHMPAEWPEEPVYRGHEGMRRVTALWTENFDDYRWDEDELIDLGDRIVGLWHHRGRLRETGDWIEQRVGTVWYFRERKILRVLSYFSWEEALEAAGVEDKQAATPDPPAS
jgi:ketosteroid isomerase-like protein